MAMALSADLIGQRWTINGQHIFDVDALQLGEHWILHTRDDDVYMTYRTEEGETSFKMFGKPTDLPHPPTSSVTPSTSCIGLRSQ